MDSIVRFLEKVNLLAELIENQSIAELAKKGLACESNVEACKVIIKRGRKYFKIDIGTSGRYMVDREGNIYGIKAYGQIHLGHSYGTLNTIDDYYWGDYLAYKYENKITDEKERLINQINKVYPHINDLTKFNIEQLQKHLDLITKEKENKKE